MHKNADFSRDHAAECDPLLFRDGCGCASSWRGFVPHPEPQAVFMKKTMDSGRVVQAKEHG
jgi:hypothetical protein